MPKYITEEDQVMHGKPPLRHDVLIRLTPKEAAHILSSTTEPSPGTDPADVLVRWFKALTNIANDVRDEG